MTICVADTTRIALAESEDLFHWKRLGLATFALWHGIYLADVDDKDASLFPVAARTCRFAYTVVNDQPAVPG